MNLDFRKKVKNKRNFVSKLYDKRLAKFILTGLSSKSGISAFRFKDCNSYLYLKYEKKVLTQLCS